MKNIFIVSSCMYPLIGVVDRDSRYEQTIETFDSIRRKVPDSKIIFIDSSVYPIEQERLDVINSKVDIFLDFSKDEHAQNINKHGLKSHGETYLLLNAIHYVKNTYDVTGNGRMFKMGARCHLENNFDIRTYDNMENKFVFKKRLNSWMSSDIQSRFGSTNILETRLYSWSFSMIDEYIQILNKNVELLNLGLDTEHAHFLNIPSEKLVEYDMLNVGCIMALNGQYMHD